MIRTMVVDDNLYLHFVITVYKKMGISGKQMGETESKMGLIGKAK